MPRSGQRAAFIPGATPCPIFSPCSPPSRSSRCSSPTSPSARKSEPMPDLALAGAVALGLLIYLVWALVRPEDF
ncbi:K(+)-transporting ATPase subunit F [Acidiphilium acidophilum]